MNWSAGPYPFVWSKTRPTLGFFGNLGRHQDPTTWDNNSPGPLDMNTRVDVFRSFGNVGYAVPYPYLSHAWDMSPAGVINTWPQSDPASFPSGQHRAGLQPVAQAPLQPADRRVQVLPGVARLPEQQKLPVEHCRRRSRTAPPTGWSASRPSSARRSPRPRSDRSWWTRPTSTGPASSSWTTPPESPRSSTTPPPPSRRRAESAAPARPTTSPTSRRARATTCRWWSTPWSWGCRSIPRHPIDNKLMGLPTANQNPAPDVMNGTTNPVPALVRDPAHREHAHRHRAALDPHRPGRPLLPALARRCRPASCRRTSS